MQIEIWSDVICPWCYIGKRRFEQALTQSGQRDMYNQWGQTRLIPALEMDVLRCKSQHMVDKEIAVYFLAYNLVRWAGCGSLARGGIASSVEF